MLFIAHGTQQFIGLSGEKISFKETLWEGKQHYTWDEVEKVIYRENRLSGRLAEFEFHFRDGVYDELEGK